MSPDLDLGGFIHDAAKRSAPAVVEPSDLEMASDFDGLTDELLDQVIHVIDPTTGTAWAFNHAAVYVASTGAARWTWYIAPPLSSAAATLIGVDHKERPRFAIANVIIAADGPPVIA